MDTKGQILVFLSCVAVGFIGGILYEPIALLRLAFGCGKGKNKPLSIALDIVFWLAFSILCVAASYQFRFPDFRVYTWIGYAVGGIIYLKSLRRIVAFLENVCYNKLIKIVKRRKIGRKTPKKADKKV